jgi:hypothetical protein
METIDPRGRTLRTIARRHSECRSNSNQDESQAGTDKPPTTATAARLLEQRLGVSPCNRRTIEKYH